MDLTDEEWAVLRAGLVEWGGPARVTEEFAVAIGFRSQADLFAQADRIIEDLQAHRPLYPVDWARTVLATEIVFISDLIGSGRDWSITTGFTDADTLRIIREIQRKLPRAVVCLIGSSIGTKPPGQPPR